MVKILEFGKIKTGEMVNKYIITNANGSYVEIIDYGCKICKIVVPNKNKELVYFSNIKIKNEISKVFLDKIHFEWDKIDKKYIENLLNIL